MSSDIWISSLRSCLWRWSSSTSSHEGEKCVNITCEGKYEYWHEETCVFDMSCHLRRVQLRCRPSSPSSPVSTPFFAILPSKHRSDRNLIFCIRCEPPYTQTLSATISSLKEPSNESVATNDEQSDFYKPHKVSISEFARRESWPKVCKAHYWRPSSIS
jgi:hypothetical protein